MDGRLIVVVTGANTGIGFGICHRLLCQLSHPNPQDAAPFYCTQKNGAGLESSYPGPRMNGTEETKRKPPSLTIIMACRNQKRAEAARAELFHLLDEEYIDKFRTRQKVSPCSDDLAYTQAFRKNLQIDIIPLNLADMRSVFHFSDTLMRKYPYISHLICNAGVASFTSVNKWTFIKEFIKNPIDALTTAEYCGQTIGDLSVNGLGWVWQCNVFGHYSLFRSIEPLLLTSHLSTSLGPRVIWMSSITALAHFYDKNDWECIKSEHAYQASKYQMELLVTQIERVSLATHGAKDPSRIMHVIVDPGVTSTNFSAKLRNCFTTILQIFLFYLVRFLGSPHHTITPYKAAVSAVQLSLVPLYFLNAYKILENDQFERRRNLRFRPNEPNFSPRRFCSTTDWLGGEGVRVSGVSKWKENERLAEQLLGQFKELYEYWRNKTIKDMGR